MDGRPRDEWGRRLISKTTAISAESRTDNRQPTGRSRLYAAPQSSPKCWPPRRTHNYLPFFAGVFLLVLRRRRGVDCIFCSDCHWAISKRKPSIVQRRGNAAVSPFPPRLFVTDKKVEQNLPERRVWMEAQKYIFDTMLEKKIRLTRP